MKIKIILTVFLVLSFNPLFSVTGDEALSKFRARMNGIEKMTGVISWTTSSGVSYTGNFKYLNPGRIHIKFSNPAGRTVVSNGRTLWVYSPASNIVGVQELSRDGSGGITSFTNGYMALLTDQGPGGYIVKLKNESRHYQEVTLMLDSSFFLKKAVLKSKDGFTYTFTLSNISTAATVLPGTFNFEVPANAQRVNNPLNIQ